MTRVRRWCTSERLALDLELTHTGISYRLVLRNGVLTYTAAPQASPADAVIRLPLAVLPVLARGTADPAALASAGVTVDGDVTAITRLIAALDRPDPGFAIVTP